MLLNYVLISLRSLRRSAGFTALNVVGLGISMAVGLLLILFIRDQADKDNFHENADRIYRVYSDFKSSFNRDNALYATSPANLSDLLAEGVPGVKKSIRVRSGFGGTVVYDGAGLPLSGFYADDAFLDLFSFDLASGDPNTALTTPHTVVLSPATAERYFGDRDPLGEVLSIEGGGELTVTGVLERDDYPSHFPLTALVSYATLESDPATVAVLEDWTQSIYRSYTYFQLEDGASSKAVQSRIDQLIPQHFGERDENRLHRLQMQPLTEINLGTMMGNEIGTVMPRALAYFLSGLALIILLTACFNYVGLTVSRSLKRAREVGVRKMFGAKRQQVFTQFLVESLLISTFSVLVGAGLLLLLVPEFNSLMFVVQTGAHLALDFKSDPGIYAVLAVFTLAIALVAGLYPAVYLSKFEPARAVKGLSDLSGAGGSRLRKSLVVVQFTLSVVFIVLTVTMFRQSKFMLNADYGFEQDNIVNVELFSVPYLNFRQELSSSPNVESISGTSPLPAMGSRRDRWLRASVVDDQIKGYVYYIDEHFIDNLSLDLIAGRNVSPDFASDLDRTVIVNETLVRQLALGAPEEAVGKMFILGDSTEMEVAGVVRDYQADSFSAETPPNYLQYAPTLTDWANVRVVPGRYAEAIDDIRAAWTSLGSARPLEFERFDLQIKNSFTNLIARDTLNLIGFFAILAIVIAGLGLLGIASYNVERRTREISIRKVLGATATNVVGLLSREFLILMGISLLVAVPGSWFLSTSWLQIYARRIDFGVGTILFGVGAIMTLALIVISSQTVRAAFDNPVDNLHDD